ncbi:hypothetical protein BFJ72_g12937 [Fusarium proliferatum]|uniref:Uncharacterized protein n=1 Tax=Gibberella intermedia TaxID=948311 RepID=A0A420SEY5_GIBIN|nr:hypothetical protein BFJ72_g12937 [Fusarium proliferatum]
MVTDHGLLHPTLLVQARLASSRTRIQHQLMNSVQLGLSHPRI